MLIWFLFESEINKNECMCFKYRAVVTMCLAWLSTETGGRGKQQCWLCPKWNIQLLKSVILIINIYILTMEKLCVLLTACNVKTVAGIVKPTHNYNLTLQSPSVLPSFIASSLLLFGEETKSELKGEWKLGGSLSISTLYGGDVSVLCLHLVSLCLSGQKNQLMQV